MINPKMYQEDSMENVSCLSIHGNKIHKSSKEGGNESDFKKKVYRVAKRP